MLKKIISIISLTILVSCSEAENKDSPADTQIAEYSKTLSECADNKSDPKGGSTQPIIEKETTPKIEADNASLTPIVNKIHIRGFGIEAEDFVLGNKDAKVVVMEYFSPTCPHCVTFHNKIFPELEKKYIATNKIAYVTREFIGNKQDLDATILARCDGSFKSYKNFMQIILQQQDSWAFSKNYREILTNIGTLGGINPEKYAACLNDEAKIQVILDNTKLIAKEPQFVGTPAFFINGKKYNKLYTAEELSKAIDAALSKNE